MVELKTKDLILDKGKSREIVIAENIDLVRLLDISWLWSQKKRKNDADFQAAREEQHWYSKFSVHSKPESSLCVKFPDVYSLIYNFSGSGVIP